MSHFDNSQTGLPPGTCLIHGSYIGSVCPRCSTAVVPSMSEPLQPPTTAAVEAERDRLREHADWCAKRANEIAAERDQLFYALESLIEAAEDMRSYVPEYFAKKWKHDEHIERAKGALAGVAATEANR